MTTTPDSSPQPLARRLRRSVLRPGVHVLRRSATELQVGLAPERALVLPDTPDVRCLLEALAGPAATPSGAYDADALQLLSEHGMLVDADLLLPLAPDGPDRAGDIAATACRTGDRTPALLQARGARVVEVVPAGADPADGLARQLVSLLAPRGARCRLPGDPPERGGGRDAETGLGVVVAVGEPARELLDPWMRSQTPHLLLRLHEGAVTIGPFVVPGQSACLRCLDAHHTDVDPVWPLLVTQHAAACARPRPDTLAEPVDPLLAALGCAWTAREAVTWLEGDRPPTTGTTVRLDPTLTCLESHAWPHHPACGCDWG